MSCNTPQQANEKADSDCSTKQALSQIHHESDTLMFERFARNFQIFVLFLMPISIFGASVFSIIFGQMTDPKDIFDYPMLSLLTVRTLLALAWLSFVLVLGLGGLSLGLLATHEENGKGVWTPKTIRKLRRLGLMAVVLLYSLTIGGFMFMAIALTAYVQGVAFVAIGYTAIAGIIATVACFYQWQKSVRN
ncbi:hypothetical protein F4781DRAFT_155051 [Annulohypoxylon bovei var. microspora]|nr:hypothetical protein F4781DRAFT_155051 [Annulohypoxylon bovei var. microspora]